MTKFGKKEIRVAQGENGSWFLLAVHNPCKIYSQLQRI